MGYPDRHVCAPTRRAEISSRYYCARREVKTIVEILWFCLFRRLKNPYRLFLYLRLSHFDFPNNSIISQISYPHLHERWPPTIPTISNINVFHIFCLLQRLPTNAILIHTLLLCSRWYCSTKEGRALKFTPPSQYTPTRTTPCLLFFILIIRY